MTIPTYYTLQLAAAEIDDAPEDSDGQVEKEVEEHKYIPSKYITGQQLEKPRKQDREGVLTPVKQEKTSTNMK